MIIISSYLDITPRGTHGGSARKRNVIILLHPAPHLQNCTFPSMKWMVLDAMLLKEFFFGR